MSHLNAATKSITEVMTQVDEAKDKLTSEQYLQLSQSLSKTKKAIDRAKKSREKARDMYCSVFEEAQMNKTTVEALQQYIFKKQNFCSCCATGGFSTDSNESDSD